MDYKYWCQFLTEEEFINWETEALISEIDEPTRVFSRDFDEFENFISISFIWGSTKQGREYWYNISKRNI